MCFSRLCALMSIFTTAAFAKGPEFAALKVPRNEDVTAAVFGQVDSPQDLCPGTTVMVSDAQKLATDSNAVITVLGHEVANVYACMMRASGHRLRSFRGSFSEYGPASDATLGNICMQMLYHTGIWNANSPRQFPDIARGYCVPEALLDEAIRVPSLPKLGMMLGEPRDYFLTFTADVETRELDEPPGPNMGQTGFTFSGASMNMQKDAERSPTNISPPLFRQ